MLLIVVLWLQISPGFAKPDTSPSLVLKEQQVLDDVSKSYSNVATNSLWEHLEIDDSIYESPYKISLFNAQNGEDSERLWSQTKLVLGAVVALAGTSFLLPEGVTNFSEDKKQEALDEKWLNHVKDGPVWDRDKLLYNIVGHPYSGGMYYQIARKSGYRQWDSAFYAFLMSTFMWEYGVESLAETPSIQDIVVTPTLGWVMGEWMYHKEQEILQRGGTVWGSKRWGNTARFLLDPMDFIGGWINNRLGRQFIKAGTGYIAYSDIAIGNRGNPGNGASEKQLSVGFQYTLNNTNKAIKHKKYRAKRNDPVDSGIVGISLGFAQTRLQDQVIRLITPAWSYAYYDDFVAENTYPEWSLGLYFSPRFSSRLRYGRAQVQTASTNEEFRYENYGIDSQYYFNVDGNTRPYLSFGIGEEIFDTDWEQSNFLVTYGLGLHHKINPRWAVYGSWIFHHAASADVSQQSLSVNLLYRFGKGEDGSL